MTIRQEIDNFVGLIKNITYVGVLVSLLAGAVWSAVDVNVREWVRHFIGVDALNQRIDDLDLRFGVEMSRINDNLAVLRQDVDGITPEVQIVEWDPEATQLVGNCYIAGAKCQLLLRARRTYAGESCGVPENVDMWVRISTNHLYRVYAHDSWHPFRLTRSYESFIIPFIPPAVGTPGLAYFFADIRYADCRIGNETTLARRTIEFPFELEHSEE